MTQTYDVFISHASEDKDEVARPLAEMLQSRGLRVWFDEMELRLGDSLRRGIDRGLSQSRYGLVVLSPYFLSKDWPNKELDGLVAREDGNTKVILPIWHKVSKEDIEKYSPILAGKLAAPTSKGLTYIVDQVVREVEATRHATTPIEEPSRLRGAEVSHLLLPFIDGLNERAEHGHAHGFEEVTGVRTGFAELDRITSGLQPGTLTFVGGRPLTGKTTFALQVAQHVAVSEGLPVLYCSPTTAASQTTERLISVVGDIQLEHLRIARLEDYEWFRLSEAVEQLGKATLHICDEPEITVRDLQVEARRKAKRWGAVGAIVVDSLQDLAENSRGDEGQTCRELRKLARELNCPVLVTSDLGRAIEARPDKRPMLSDAPELTSIDVVLFLYRHGLYYRNEDDTVEVIVASHRERGVVAVVELGFGLRGRLENLAPAADD